MLEPATLAGVLEDHHYEQFFFDEPTREALLSLMAGYELPLLLCTPSLAVAAEQAGQRCLLLDRDERFAFLSAFQAFNVAIAILHNQTTQILEMLPPREPGGEACVPRRRH